MTHERTVIYQVWNKQTGDRIEIGADRDGLAITEIRSVSAAGRIEAAILVPDEALELFAQIFLDYRKARESGDEPTV